MGGGKPQYIELVHWREAQPNMPERDAPWMKLYTSLLDNDAFESLDDAARMLLIAMWLYAARSGRHVFPADGKWLRRRIPMLNGEPDLQPLLEAVDSYGRPQPFIRIVDKAGIYNVQNIVDKEGIYNVGNSTEERREETKRKSKTKPSRVSEKEIEKKKRNASATADAVVSKQQNQKEKKNKAQTQGTTTDEGKTENPQNPRKSEAGGPACANAPKAPSSLHSEATGPEPLRLGKIPIWWSDPACVGFSYAVLEALGLRCDPESDRGKSERGTFAAWLFSARARVAARDWGWLQDKAISKAREIARYGKSARKPGAVWLSVMAKELGARAGPGEDGTTEVRRRPGVPGAAGAE